MSDKLPEGWDTQSSRPTPVEIDDDALAGHLHRRAAHTAPSTLTTAILARVDETAPERLWRLTLAAWRPRMAVAVSGLTLAVVAGLLYVNATPRIGTDRATTSPSAASLPSAVASGPVWDPAQRALTPPELLRILATDPAPGTVLIVDDLLARLDTPCLKAGGFCPPAEKLVSAGTPVSAPIGGHLPIQGIGEIPGPLALRVTAGPTLEFLGAVVSNGGRLEFRASDLAKRSAVGGLFVVPAWLWATAVTPCASVGGTPVPMPTSELGLAAPRLACFPIAWLTDTASTDPSRGGGVGLPVQNGAHDAFAPNRGNNPSQGVYLVRDWAGSGEILARLEPRLIPPADAIAPTTEPTVRPSPDSAGGIVMSVDELIRRVLDGSLEPDSIAVVSVTAGAVSERWAPGVAHSCPQLCPTWHLLAGTRSIDVVVSMQAPAAPKSIVGVQAFLVVDRGSVRALGPTATWPTGGALDGAAVVAIGDGLSAVHGLLRIGPPLPCPQAQTPRETGILGEPLSWSQCPGTWILPSEGPDPWASPPNAGQATNGSGSTAFGDLSVPDGTIHVQDGAERADLDARGGLWLVRAAVTNACPPWARCPGPSDSVNPQPGVTWYELVGPIVAPAATGPGPRPSTPPSASPFVLSRDRLVATVKSRTYSPGTIVITDATFAPVLLPAAVPALGDIVAKVGGISVYWGSDTSIGVPDPRYSVVRIREDGGLDYLGPATLAPDGGAYASSAVPVAQGLVLVHGWFYRPTFELRCLEPRASGEAQAFRAFDGQKQNLECDPAWILPSSEDPFTVMGGTRMLDMPTGAFPVQIRDVPWGGPTEGLFLVRHVACLWSGDLDICAKPTHDTWELVGPVVVPGT